MATGYAERLLPYRSRLSTRSLAMQAPHGYSAYMSKQARRLGRFGSPPSPPTVQYTVRSVPAHVDKALRRRAQNERKSLNEVLRDALIREAEGTDAPERVYTDLDALAGSWVDVPGFDDAIEAQHRVEEALWR